MKKYLRKEVMTPVAVFAFLIAYVMEAMKNSAPVIDGVPQESFFPLLIFIFGILADVFLLKDAVKLANQEGERKKDGERKPVSFKPFYVVLAAGLFIFLFDILGFLLTAPFFVFAMMLIYDDRPQQIPRKILFSALITAVIYILYTYVFEINFPQIWR
ncbi:MAG: tripartite tricarboxylate transporter TctB family protein [Lachnospiraceae bacterium]|nr:tripartite tricarboxylate transporter TctB family protein [Lachnospiraceae bacterium]